MPNKTHPILIIMALLLGIPIAIWLLVLGVGIVGSIGEWFSYSTGTH